MGDPYVGLIRVSTQEQEESGLGLKSGRRDIDEYIKYNKGELITVLEEICSGGFEIVDRPILKRALSLCRRHKATLLVPKIDRLIRSTEVHTDLKRSGVPIRACDNPHANEFMLDVLVAFAANERREIKKRTKKALLEYKETKAVSDYQLEKLRAIHGPEVPAEAIAAVAGKLGSHLVGSKLTETARAKGRAKANANSARKAVEVYDDLVAEMRDWRSSGMTLAKIAVELNERGDRTRTGARWSKVQVKRTLDRARAVDHR